MMRLPLTVALLALAAIAALAFSERGAAMGAAALIGGGAGFALYHAAFGFTAAWRRLSRERRGAGLRAQMLLIGATCAVTYLLIGYEGSTGWAMRPVIMPMGLASALGAFMFGAGMQLGGSCASGTLFTVGGGSTRMVVTLLFFILGSAWATAHIPGFWAELPKTGGVSMIDGLGPPGALALMAALLGGIALASAIVERRAHGRIEPPRLTRSVLMGPWSLTLGALALAAVGIATFLALGRPWSVTWGFTIWGAKILSAAGVDVGGWTYWSGWRADALRDSVFANGTSVMNFGIVFGAMAAAALAGRWAPGFRISPREIVTAIVGGLMMGYGARLAYGCNIGAYLGGLVSGSLHGWWWLIWGFAGSTLGVWARGRLAMDPPLTPRPA